MQPIRAHLPAAIKHLRWAYLSLGAVLASVLSSTPAHATVAPMPGDLHSSRDASAIRLAVRTVMSAPRQHSDRALALHKVRAGETLTGDAVRYCHGNASYWTGIYAASRARHLTSANANVLNVGQLLAIDCAYKPGELRWAAGSTYHRHAQTVAYIARSGGGGDQAACTPNCPWGDGDGDGMDQDHSPWASAPVSRVYSAPRYQAHTVYRGSQSSVRPSSTYEACVIARESGGNSQVMNSSGHYGLYQFSESTWEAYGGSAASFGRASAATQHQVFANAMAQGGQSNWSPYDGC